MESGNQILGLFILNFYIDQPPAIPFSKRMQCLPWLPLKV